MDAMQFLEDEVSDIEETAEVQKMVRIDFAVPESLLKEMLEIARSHGWKPAEFHRMVWAQGSFLYIEQSNKLLVNRQLRQKLMPK